MEKEESEQAIKAQEEADLEMAMRIQEEAEVMIEMGWVHERCY